MNVEVAEVSKLTEENARLKAEIEQAKAALIRAELANGKGGYGRMVVLTFI